MTWDGARSLCEICRRWAAGRLCNACVSRHLRNVPRCRRCALPVGAEVDACGECSADPPSFERTVCVSDYGYPWDRLLASLKFQGQPELAVPLADLLAQAVGRSGAEAVDVVVPVPLSHRRLAERGYNQAWELARRVARATRKPARGDAIERVTDDAHQTDLPRAQRLANLRSAFAVAPGASAVLQGRRVALVDDVMTTGATVRHAAAALRRAGAASVTVWVFARTAA